MTRTFGGGRHRQTVRRSRQRKRNADAFHRWLSFIAPVVVVLIVGSVLIQPQAVEEPAPIRLDARAGEDGRIASRAVDLLVALWLGGVSRTTTQGRS